MKAAVLAIKGVTLLETMLVLTIGAMILMMSMRLFYGMQKDAEYRVLEYNVDLLFQGAANYYYAQCSRQWSATGGPIAPASGAPQSLDPGPASGGYTPPSTSTPLFVNYATTLQAYLPAPLKVSSLVSTSGGTTNPAYIVQFNPINVGSPAALPTKTVVATTGSPVTVGSILVWQIQVSANISSSLSQVLLAKTYLNAQCNTSVSGSSSVATTCSNATASSVPYVAWTRLPNASNGNVITNYWLSNPLLNQFKQMYTTYPISYLTGTNSMSGNQYYLCGS